MPQDGIRFEPLGPVIGAEVSGVDLRLPLDGASAAALRAGLLEHLVLFFRDQTLDPAGLVAAASQFGSIGRYPLVAGMSAHPDVVEVVKREDERDNFGGIWHSDTTYLETPPLGSMLYARELPAVGGDTLFANMYAACECLSPAFRRLLEPLRAINSAAKPDAAAGRRMRSRERPGEADEQVLEAIHPVVRTHPETGRGALFVNPGHTLRLDGFSVEESAPLLAHLYAVQQRPEFACRFRWTPGAVALWDNRCTQHLALNDYHGHRRVMWRVTLSG